MPHRSNIILTLCGMQIFLCGRVCTAEVHVEWFVVFRVCLIYLGNPLLLCTELCALK